MLSSSSEMLTEKNPQCPKSTEPIAAKRKTCSLGGKKVCIALSITIIALLWLALLFPLIAVLVMIPKHPSGLFSSTNDLFLSLPPINNTHNYTNFTIVQVECVGNFVYVPGEELCYPECFWNPAGEEVTRTFQLTLTVLHIIALIIGTGTLVAWIATSCVDWKKFRIHYDFQLPRTSLFMVVLSSLVLIVINASIHFVGREFLFCSRTEEGRAYLLAHLTHAVRSDDPTALFISNLLGAIVSFALLVDLCWIVFSMINIFVIVFFPNLRESFRKRILIFCFQCFVSFGGSFISIAISLAINPQSPYAVSYLVYLIIYLNQWVFLFFDVIPMVVLPSITITLAVIIVAKIRINSLQSKELLGSHIKLTGLEKRLILYSIILVMLLFLHGIGAPLLVFLSIPYIETIRDFILCMTVNSPIVVVPSSLNGTYTNSTMNSTSLFLYRENPYGGVDACRMLEAQAERELPHSIYFIFAIYIRLVWTPIFIVLIPYISPKLLWKMVSKSRGSNLTGRVS